MRNAPRDGGALQVDDRQEVQDSTVAPATDYTHEARCRRCNRPLYTDLAVAAGLAPICAMAAIARVPYRTRQRVMDQLTLPIEAVSGRG